MPACCAINCTSRPEKTSGKTFHAFPRSNPQLYQRWVVNLKRDKWTPSPGSRLCSDHFEEGCFDRTGARIRLLRDAVPTLFSFPKHLQKKTAGRKPPKERTPAEDTTPENEPTTSTRTSTEDNLANLSDHNYAVFESPKTLKRKMDLCVDSVVGVKKKLKVNLERERRLRKKQRLLAARPPRGTRGQSRRDHWCMQTPALSIQGYLAWKQHPCHIRHAGGSYGRWRDIRATDKRRDVAPRVVHVRILDKQVNTVVTWKRIVASAAVDRVAWWASSQRSATLAEAPRHLGLR
ncbi:THAP domain-containing protein 6-like [Dermacentor variabilis]|uniref:THAP domain-containing protein 6-like n=1 Tax=Dermacentor variabilis TaxID=34621 RepID=UPI003F5BC3DE